MWKGSVPGTNIWPKLSDSVQVTLKSCPSSLVISTPSTAAICCEDTYKSFSGCLLKGEHEESFLFTLANVLQVLPWGSVIVGHLRHCWREGNYWGALPKRRGQCAGNAEYTRVYAKINTRTHKGSFAIRTLSHSLSHAPAYKAHTHTQTTLACALKLLTWAWLLFAPHSSHFLIQTLPISEVWLMGFIFFMFPGRGLALSLKKPSVWVSTRDRSVSLQGGSTGHKDGMTQRKAQWEYPIFWPQSYQTCWYEMCHWQSENLLMKTYMDSIEFFKTTSSGIFFFFFFVMLCVHAVFPWPASS